MRQIVVEKVISADDADFLSGSDLESIPANARIVVFFSSTQDDTLLSITGPNILQLVDSQAVTMRSGAEIRQNEDVPYSFTAQRAGRYVIDVNIQTAATVRGRVIALLP